MAAVPVYKGEASSFKMSSSSFSARERDGRGMVNSALCSAVKSKLAALLLPAAGCVCSGGGAAAGTTGLKQVGAQFKSAGAGAVAQSGIILSFAQAWSSCRDDSAVVVEAGAAAAGVIVVVLSLSLFSGCCWLPCVVSPSSARIMPSLRTGLRKRAASASGRNWGCAQIPLLWFSCMPRKTRTAWKPYWENWRLQAENCFL